MQGILGGGDYDHCTVAEEIGATFACAEPDVLSTNDIGVGNTLRMKGRKFKDI